MNFPEERRRASLPRKAAAHASGANDVANNDRAGAWSVQAPGLLGHQNSSNNAQKLKQPERSTDNLLEPQPSPGNVIGGESTGVRSGLGVVDSDAASGSMMAVSNDTSNPQLASSSWRERSGRAAVGAMLLGVCERVCSLRRSLQNRAVGLAGGPELQRRDAAQRDPEGMVISSNSYLSYIIYRST